MTLFIEQWGYKVKIIEEVVKAVVGNAEGGKKVMELLFKRQGYKVNIIKKVVKAVVGNTESR